MKKWAAFFLPLLLAGSLLGCNWKGGGDEVVKPPIWEGTLQALQETSEVENIIPVVEEMPWVLSEKYTGSEIPDYDYKSLVFYYANGKRGLAGLDGTILADAEYDVKWCDAHGFCDSEYAISFDKDFNQTEHYGHGSLLGSCYYDPELQSLVGGNEGPSTQISPGDYAFESFKEFGRIPGLFETGSYYIPDENYPGEGSVKPLGKYVILNGEGKPITSTELEAGSGFLDGVCLAKEDGKWSLLDEEGNPLFSQTYDGAYHFSEGLAPVSQDGKWGYIRKDGSVAVPFRYEEARPALDGTAWVKSEGTWKRIVLPI